jgi:hypothetical protein
MGMMEDMQMMQYLQQAAAQQPPMGGMPQQDMQQQQMPQQMPQRRNPLEAGSRTAIEAAKRSLEMSDVENQRALGRALIGMASGMKNSHSYGQGFAGNIGALTDGLAPALNAYDQERARIENLNYAIAQQQKEEAALARKEEREMKKMAHEMEIAQKRLAIEQGYFGLKKQEKEAERKEMELLSKPGAEIPLATLGQSGWNYVQKYMDQNTKEIESTRNAIDYIDEAGDILERNPNITKHWAMILTAAQKKDPGYINQQLLNKVDKQTLIDAQLLTKNLSNLYTSEAGGFTPRAMNKYWEQQIKEGAATPDLRAEAILHLLKDKRELAVAKYKNNLESDEAYRNRGTFKRAKPIMLDYNPEETTKYADKKKSEKAAKDPSAILEEIRRLEEMMKTAPE